MKTSNYGCYGLIAGVAFVMLAGCAGGTQVTPSATSGPQLSRFAHSPCRGNTDIFWYTMPSHGSVGWEYYPCFDKRGTLSISFSNPTTLCIDNAGAVYVVNAGAYDVIKWDPSTSSEFVYNPENGNYPLGCAVNPSNGDLAVTLHSVPSNPSQHSGIAVYQPGNPNAVQSRVVPGLATIAFDGYDKHGNLFFDGTDGSGNVVLYRYVRYNFKQITISGATLQNAGPVQYADGSLTVMDGQAFTVYRMQENGAVTGSTILVGLTKSGSYPDTLYQSYILNKNIFATFSSSNPAFPFIIDTWKYPSGSFTGYRVNFYSSEGPIPGVVAGKCGCP